MATLTIVNVDNQQAGNGLVPLESEKRYLTPEEIIEITEHVIPRVRSLLAEPFIRYSGTPDEIVEAVTDDYLAGYRAQRESEALKELRLVLERRKALEDLKNELDALLTEERILDIREAIKLVYTMQMAELDQLRTGLRRDLEQVSIYPELIVSLKETLWVQYRGAQAAPGTAVGHIATDSISAPAVQLTLDTFHSTGSVMTVDSGLELLQSVLYATKTVRNPFMTVHFNDVEHVEHIEQAPKGKAAAKKKRGAEKPEERVLRKEYISFEKVLTEKRAEMRHLTFPHVMDAQTIDTRAKLVGRGKNRAPWWYELYGEAHNRIIKPIGENQYMMRIELNMNELYLSRVDQFEIANVLWRELKNVQIVASPILRYPARFGDFYASGDGEEDDGFDPDREVLVPVIYIDILPDTANQDAPEEEFYESQNFHQLSETVNNSFHDITVKGIPGIIEVQPGNTRILEVIREAREMGNADDLAGMLDDADSFKAKKHASERLLTGVRAYPAADLEAERRALGFLKIQDAGLDTGGFLHLPEKSDRETRPAGSDKAPAVQEWTEAVSKRASLKSWELHLDHIGMRMKGFSRAKIEDALEYAGVRLVGWVDEVHAMNYIPQTDILECISSRNPHKLLQELISDDEQLAVTHTLDQMKRKVELYKQARFQEANRVSVERKSSILERLCFTALADVRGYNLEKVWAMSSVNASLTYCNDMHLLFEMLGIEALRNYAQEMLFMALKSAASSMDLRHINTLLDMTTRRGVYDSIKMSGLQNQNIPSMAIATLGDPLGVIVKAASTGEVSSLNSPYAAFLFGQLPSNHAAIPEVTMTPEYEQIYQEAMRTRTLEPEEIDEAVWDDMYQPQIVLADDGKVMSLQGGAVQREEVFMPVSKPHGGVLAPSSTAAHIVKDRMGRIDDWIAPMGAISAYTTKSMLKIASDEKMLVKEKEALKTPEQKEAKYSFKPFKPLNPIEYELIGVSEVPEGEFASTDLSPPHSAFQIPRSAFSIKNILAAIH